MSGPRLVTVRRARLYLLAGLVCIVAIGWYGDRRSCQRSQFLASTSNSAAAAYGLASLRAFARAKLDSGTARTLDLKASRQDYRLAQELKVGALDCAAPLPSIPKH